MSGQQGNTPSPATRPEKKRILRSPFAHEIYLVLLIKLLLILAINVIADRLRAALDPKSP